MPAGSIRSRTVLRGSRSTGLFLSTDPWDGATENPVSLHRYLYAGAQPTGLVDPTGKFSLPEISLTTVAQSALISAASMLPMRVYHAAKALDAGQELGAVAIDLAEGVATDAAIGAALPFAGRLLKFVPRVFRFTRAGNVVIRNGERIINRLASSVWNMEAKARGLVIEAQILGGPGRAVRVGEAVIDDFVDGVATSIKSVDLTLPSYQTAGAIESLLMRYARDMATYTFNRASQIVAADVRERVLVVAIEEGTAVWQADVVAQFVRSARSVFPDLKVIIAAIP
jgi:hypothetical protein